MINGTVELNVAKQDAGLRLDSYIAYHIPECSRSYAATLIQQGNVQIEGVRTKPGYKIKPGECINVIIPEPAPVALIAEPMMLDIIFEDGHIIVLNKPAGLVVHPAAGHPSGTLVNGILHHCPDLEGIGGERRPGIVHRLDKDTSGIIVIAKNAGAHQELSIQFKARTIGKRYLALVHGVPESSNGIINLPVGRHPVDRKKMSTASRSGREALTLWKIKETFHQTALLDIELKTGRTHQIRVHCKSMGHPIIGDSVYGPRRLMSRLSKSDKSLYNVVHKVDRQMLHAYHLELVHPATRNKHRFVVPLPGDLQEVIEDLKRIG